MHLIRTTITVRTAFISPSELHPLALRPQVFQINLSQEIYNVFKVVLGCIISLYECMYIVIYSPACLSKPPQLEVITLLLHLVYIHLYTSIHLHLCCK